MSIFAKVEPIFVGDVVYDVRGEFGPRRQPHLQLVYIYNGEVRVRGPGFDAHLHGGEAFFMVPGVSYRLDFDAGERVRHGWVDLPTVYAPPAWLAAPGSEVRVFAFSERTRTLAQLANDAPRETDGGESQLRQALGRAIVEEALLCAGVVDTGAEHLPAAIVRAQNYMAQHYPEPLTLDSLAQRSGVSKAHLIRLFREHTDTSPMRRLWAIRVEAGSRLLRETGLQVQEIADRCGFPSPYHFSRLIKQAHGESPRLYRQRHWGGGG